MGEKAEERVKLQFDANTLENAKKGKRDELLSFLQDGNVSFYGYREMSVPDVLLGKPASKVRIFQRGAPVEPVRDFPVSSYKRLIEIFETGADTCFVDREALMVLLAGYPVQAGYVLARLAFRWSWILGVPGLLRRILKKQVKLCGAISLESEGNRQRWLVIKRGESMPYRGFSLSSEIGLPGFFEYLHKERIQYVVLRFYQSLPKLHREWGDLDILVADEDHHRSCEFLAEHPGLIKIDVWAVSSVYAGQMAYYPPPLAKRILESAKDGPAGSRIPAPSEAFLSLAYHALYHKGLRSGVPSNLADVCVNPQPENDYRDMLAKMAEELGIPVNVTMEDLDDYLHQQGWRPKLDTLAKIASQNEWVSHRFFTRGRTEEIGLGVFILRRKAFSLGIVDSILNMVKEEGFFILRRKEFDEQEKLYVADHLRGGNWSLEGEKIEELLPAMAVIVLDVHSGLDGKGGRVESLKARLRQSFDSGGASVVHSTDTTLEAWEYIKICFEKEAAVLEEEIRRVKGTSTHSLKERLAFYPKILEHYCKKALNSLRNVPISLLRFAVRWFLQS